MPSPLEALVAAVAEIHAHLVRRGVRCRPFDVLAYGQTHPKEKLSAAPFDAWVRYALGAPAGERFVVDTDKAGPEGTRVITDRIDAWLLAQGRLPQA